MSKRTFNLDDPNGHAFPKLVSADELDMDGRYTAVCSKCGCSFTVTPNFVGDDGFLRRRLDRADDAVYKPCIGVEIS